jgi:hypothetical protein
VVGEEQRGEQGGEGESPRPGLRPPVQRAHDPEPSERLEQQARRRQRHHHRQHDRAEPVDDRAHEAGEPDEQEQRERPRATEDERRQHDGLAAHREDPEHSAGHAVQRQERRVVDREHVEEAGSRAP